MRNGAHRSDRGNAILSTVALADSSAFELPFVRQRRSAVTTRIAGLPAVLLASAHLDVSGQPDRRRLGPFGAGRSIQAKALAERLVTDANDSVFLGADLNTQLGMFDPALRALVEAGLRPARRVGRWRHTYHKGPVRLLLDHVLYLAPPDHDVAVSVRRLDERPGDRGRHVFGSDHHPLLVAVDLDVGAKESR
jgi:endonuclease/exonuclease/phosphatase family metal-dependent hydrolase